MCSHLDNSVSPLAMALDDSQEVQRDDIQNRRWEGRQPGVSVVSETTEVSVMVLRITVKLQLT